MRERVCRWATSRWWIPAWAVLGFVVRLVLVARYGGEARFADERDYDAIAEALLAGRGFSLASGPTAFRPPGQPFFLMAVYGVVGHHPMIAEVVQAALLSLMPFAVARVTRLSGGRPVVVGLAAALASMHPGLAYASATLYPAALTAAALTVGVWLAAEAVEGKGMLCAAGAAIALAIAGGATTYLAILPLPAAIVALIRRRRREAALIAILGLAPAGAWMARNAIIMGAPVLSTNAGYNLALGANDLATPRSGNWIEPPDLTPVPKGEVERDAAFRAEAYRWIGDHFPRYVGLVLGRAVAVADSVGKPKTRGPHDGVIGHLVGWSLLPWVLLGMLGLWYARREPPTWLAAAALGLILMASAATIVKPRFRFPCDPLLAGFAVLAVDRLLNRFKNAGSDVPEAAQNRSAA